MEITEIALFNFLFGNIDGVNYQFSIPAKNRAEACAKLEAGLTRVLEELRSGSKANLRPS
jgi:hypothetical protein